MSTILGRTFPTLDFSGGRKREYNLYNDNQRSSVVYHYLVEGMAFRPMDQMILGKTASSKGWQSMGICHYLGLVDKHKGFFKGCTPGEILSTIANLSQNTDYCLIFYHLTSYLSQFQSMTDSDHHLVYLMEKINPEENVKSQTWLRNTWLRKTKLTAIDNRILDFPDLIPEEGMNIKVEKDVYCYVSKPILKESVKSLYNYRCQICGDVVLRTGWTHNMDRINEWKYLSADVHHIMPLSKGGPDSRDNMLCLCPTCHRKFHSGEFRLNEKNNQIILQDELLGKVHNLEEKHTIVLY